MAIVYDSWTYYGTEPAAGSTVTVTFATEGFGPEGGFAHVNDWHCNIVRGSVVLDTKSVTAPVFVNNGTGTTTDGVVEIEFFSHVLPTKSTIA